MKNPYALILLVAATTAYGQINNPPTSVNIVDSTATGRAVLTATNSAAAATAIGLGTANEVTFNRVQVGGASFSADDFSGGNFVVTGGHALTFSSGGTSGATLTNLGLGAANNVTFSNITANGIVTANDSTATPATNAAAAQGIQWPGLGGSQHAAIYGGYAGAAQIALAVGTSNSLSDVATFSATGMTVNSNAIVGGTLGVTGNATFSGTANLAPSQTADSGSSLMTRDLVDARYQYVRNPTTITITNNATLTNIVSVPLSVGTWTVKMFWDMIGTINSGTRHGFEFTGSATVRLVRSRAVTGGPLTGVVNVSGDLDLGLAETSTFAFVTGIYEVSSSGTLYLKAAQNVSSADATTVGSYAHILAEKIE
jgi:hypothetical protein